ncbi:pentapeptide repeat-containing protein [Bifidobacterium castoris]|uniref:Pentapeptide repeat-containing protein n=1 Tax=Bifidobacterium castoris TaxID=2306972 RepID=A0A430FAA9_9BIFI|nr:pentapeptide repeat-containing protein [Bifidobacterium castoris]RSX49765.1 hypothetical protein D2E22_0226 [Bifidobacterium castoris]
MEQPRKPKGSPNGTGGQYDAAPAGAAGAPPACPPPGAVPDGDVFDGAVFSGADITHKSMPDTVFDDCEFYETRGFGGADLSGSGFNYCSFDLDRDDEAALFAQRGCTFDECRMWGGDGFVSYSRMSGRADATVVEFDDDGEEHPVVSFATPNDPHETPWLDEREMRHAGYGRLIEYADLARGVWRHTDIPCSPGSVITKRR